MLSLNGSVTSPDNILVNYNFADLASFLEIRIKIYSHGQLVYSNGVYKSGSIFSGQISLSSDDLLSGNLYAKYFYPYDTYQITLEPYSPIGGTLATVTKNLEPFLSETVTGTTIIANKSIDLSHGNWWNGNLGQKSSSEIVISSGSMVRSGSKNLNKPISGKSATF